jgi:pimeloyl-ACP methyl ester carboxylesterase
MSCRSMRSRIWSGFGEGRVLGRYALRLWGSETAARDPLGVLQLPEADRRIRGEALRRCFDQWYACTVDLPGTFYLEVVQRLFRDNQIADGRFVALGRVADLRAIDIPLYLLAAEDDEVIAPAQLFAAAELVSTPRDRIEMKTEAGGHLGLFMGARTIAGVWHDIAGWLARDADMRTRGEATAGAKAAFAGDGSDAPPTRS